MLHWKSLLRQRKDTSTSSIWVKTLSPSFRFKSARVSELLTNNNFEVLVWIYLAFQHSLHKKERPGNTANPRLILQKILASWKTTATPRGTRKIPSWRKHRNTLKSWTNWILLCRKVVLLETSPPGAPCGANNATWNQNQRPVNFLGSKLCCLLISSSACYLDLPSQYL